MKTAARPGRWFEAAVLFAIGVAAILTVYWATARSFYTVWRGSDTYTHCFFVLPISAALIWRRRDALRALEPEPFFPALFLIAGFGVLWLLADAASVQFYQQLALAMMIPLLVLTLFGARVARVLTFPLAFVLFVVPFGESLHPYLMNYTARAAVLGLRLTGVPVAVEGLYLTTPTGHWHVIEACSGLRFLISMSTLGALFAYLHFRRPRNRILFGLLAVLVPILANGLRAYVMVLTGYLSHREMGVGLDHFALGWAVFAIVMVIFFFLGSRWQEDPEPPPSVSLPPPSRAGATRRVGIAAAAALSLMLAPAAVSAWMWRAPDNTPLTPSAPEPRGGWVSILTPPSPWTPGYRGARAEVRRIFEREGAVVDCYIGFYRDQSRGHELIHFENVIVPRGHARWRAVAERDASVAVGTERLTVHETDIRSPSLRYMVWHWYWLPDRFTTNPVWIKVLQAKARLVSRRDDAAVVILSAPYVDDPKAARARLEAFTRDMLPSIHAAISAGSAN